MNGDLIYEYDSRSAESVFRLTLPSVLADSIESRG